MLLLFSDNAAFRRRMFSCPLSFPLFFSFLPHRAGHHSGILTRTAKRQPSCRWSPRSAQEPVGQHPDPEATAAELRAKRSAMIEQLQENKVITLQLSNFTF